MKCLYDEYCATRLNTHSKIRQHVLYPCAEKCIPYLKEKPENEIVFSIAALRHALNRCIELDALCLDQPEFDMSWAFSEVGRKERDFAELKDKWRTRVQDILKGLEILFEDKINE
ncbi:hypothetical protein UFOVP97_23 [uncultured Caudovirales phage]|uniref:Uncharacterized protein n=1 Tax=uncultured Caudovirales phage TaxID=2100421 RepID=A0A6J5LLC2_9CAUD|nr:hypothetical protein UFOVP97_23 [uncultured Caudovirales phage]CAB4134302.1 hypothetical protein UFOVP268_41 [uncultured Caudovirales phage]